MNDLMNDLFLNGVLCCLLLLSSCVLNQLILFVDLLNLIYLWLYLEC